MATDTTCIPTEYRPYGAEIKETRPYSPCRAACPAHTDVQAYVGLISPGQIYRGLRGHHLGEPHRIGLLHDLPPSLRTVLQALRC